MSENPPNDRTEQSTLEYALSIWPDTRQDSITREEAGKLAEEWAPEAVRLPCNLSDDWVQGWETACQTIAMALRFKDFHL